MRHVIGVENVLAPPALTILGLTLRDKTTLLAVRSVSLLVDSIPEWFTNMNMLGAAFLRYAA